MRLHLIQHFNNGKPLRPVVFINGDEALYLWNKLFDAGSYEIGSDNKLITSAIQDIDYMSSLDHSREVRWWMIDI